MVRSHPLKLFTPFSETVSLISSEATIYDPLSVQEAQDSACFSLLGPGIEMVGLFFPGFFCVSFSVQV